MSETTRCPKCHGAWQVVDRPGMGMVEAMVKERNDPHCDNAWHRIPAPPAVAQAPKCDVCEDCVLPLKHFGRCAFYDADAVAQAEPTRKVLRITDCDTGESTLDVVRVPEGFSLQLKYAGDDDFRSIIVSSVDAERIATALNAVAASRGADSVTESPPILAAVEAVDAPPCEDTYDAKHRVERGGAAGVLAWILQVWLPNEDSLRSELRALVAEAALSRTPAPRDAQPDAMQDTGDASPESVGRRIAKATGFPLPDCIAFASIALRANDSEKAP